VLTCRVEQVTAITDVAGDKKTTFGNKLNLEKRWQVQAVDNAGVATLQLSLTAMRNEITRPDGEVLLYDSSNPNKSNAQLREQLAKYVNVPLAVIRVNAQGAVVEVKKSDYGPASRFESEPPFKIVLPESAPVAGTEWSRTYRVTLDPPQGTGEKYHATQKYTCKAIEANAATIAVTTAVAGLPEAVSDQIPLLQMQPEGEIVFDLKTGLLRSARMKIDKELKGHKGADSSYHFQSTYTEIYVENR
jgi:hypothetical protein